MKTNLIKRVCVPRAIYVYTHKNGRSAMGIQRGQKPSKDKYCCGNRCQLPMIHPQFYNQLPFFIGILSCAITAMNPKLAKIQDKTIVRQRNVPNFAKNVKVQKKERNTRNNTCEHSAEN